MDKVYVVWERYSDGVGGWEDVVRHIFRNKEDADATTKRLKNLAKIMNNCHFFRVEERKIEEEEEKEVYPKKLMFHTSLRKNNQPTRIWFTVYHGSDDAPEIEFIPLKDNCFSTYTKGDIRGVIDFVPEENHEQHVDRAMEVINDNFDIIPQWVLGSEDGHDPRYPQGI